MLREDRALSVRKLAELSGVHYVSLVRIEGGKLDPRLSTVQRIAQALGVPLSELVGDYPTLTKRRSDGTDKVKRKIFC
jgi:transcriptional regulator with XRE-family HTH domain